MEVETARLTSLGSGESYMKSYKVPATVIIFSIVGNSDYARL